MNQKGFFATGIITVVVVGIINLAILAGVIYGVFWCADHFGLIAAIAN